MSKDAMGRLQGIIDPEDPRFEKLKSESLNAWESRVNELCESMSLGVDRFYARKSNTYNSICNSNNFCREEFCPQANTKELTQEQLADAQKPWAFNSLPGINVKAASLAEDPTHLERLCEKLRQMNRLDLWHEPLDLDEHLSAFFSNMK